MNQTTLEHFQDKLKNKYPHEDFDVLFYSNTISPTMIRCNTCHNEYYYKRAGHLYSNRKKTLCPICNTKTIQELYQKCHENNFLIKETRKSVIEPWTFVCLNCNQEFKKVPADWRFSTCPYCRQGQKNGKPKIYYQQKLDALFGENQFLILDEEVRTNRKIQVLHTCGFIRNIRIDSLLNSTGCPKCNSKISKGEQRIINFLEENNIEYEYQSKMGDTKQRFDFKIGDLIIEYNGEQHYYPISTFGGEQRFEEQQKLDQQKKKYCLENNLQLIIISYKDYSNIENILSSFLLVQRPTNCVEEVSQPSSK